MDSQAERAAPKVTRGLAAEPKRRWLHTALVASMAGIVSFSSSVQTPALNAIAASFHTSETVTAFAASSAYLIGFGIGPFFLSPVSELYGRNVVYRTSYLVFSLMQLGCALSPHIAALAVFRFVAGFCGGGIVANTGGSVADLWKSNERSAPMAVYTLACYCGPVLGPLLGGPLVEFASWSWNFWIVLILSGTNYVLALLLLPETYTATVINRTVNTKLSVLVQLGRPWKMLATEPVLFLLSLLMAFIYGVLFLDFSAYPYVFIRERGWSQAKAGLAFLGIGLGMVVATACAPLLDRQYVKRLLISRTASLPPEIRLRHLTLIAWLLPTSLFWFAWTCLPPTHWIVPILSGVLFGFALVSLFTGINSYLTDCYGRYSASALAANTFLRSFFGAGFALFATAMYRNLAPQWATSVLGFIALALAPFPLLFYVYGPWLRGKSRFHIAAVAATEQDAL